MFQVQTLFYNVSLASFPGILDERHMAIPDQKQTGLVRDYQNNKDFFLIPQNFLLEIFQDALHALGSSSE